MFSEFKAYQVLFINLVIQKLTIFQQKGAVAFSFVLCAFR